MSATAVDLVRSLYSRLCPACGKHKARGHSLCGRDYRQLPLSMRLALYKTISRGYADAFTEAMQFLGVEDGDAFFPPMESPEEGPQL